MWAPQSAPIHFSAMQTGRAKEGLHPVQAGCQLNATSITQIHRPEKVAHLFSFTSLMVLSSSSSEVET